MMPINQYGDHRYACNLPEDKFQDWLDIATPEELEQFAKLGKKYILPIETMLKLGYVANTLKPQFPPGRFIY